MQKVTVIEQVQRDFPADELTVQGFYLYVGKRTRAFINIDADEVFFTRADSNRGRNYVLFLVMFLYNRFRLLPARDSLSHTLITQIEMAKVRSFHARMQRVGNGVGYYEYWDGTQWRVRAVPFTDPDFRVQIPLPAPAADQEETYDPYEEAYEPLEELERAPAELSGPTGSGSTAGADDAGAGVTPPGDT